MLAWYRGACGPWARRAYRGLLDAAISPDETETDPDLLAARIVDTLLHGLGLPGRWRVLTRGDRWLRPTLEAWLK